LRRSGETTRRYILALIQTPCSQRRKCPIRFAAFSAGSHGTDSHILGFEISVGQEFLNTLFEDHRLFQLALPNGEHTPPLPSKSTFYRRVTHNIPIELGFPEIDPRLWHRCLAAIGMAMPKTPMNQNYAT
jgi:hypothetical protein